MTRYGTTLFLQKFPSQFKNLLRSPLSFPFVQKIQTIDQVYKVYCQLLYKEKN